MSINTDVLVVLCFLATVLGAVVAGIVWRNRPRTGSTWLAVSLVGQVFWGLGQGASLASETAQTARLWFAVSFVGIAIAPLAWLLFSMQYTGSGDRLTRPVLVGLWVVPAAFAILAVTNPGGLVFETPHLTAAGEFVYDYGPATLGYTVYHEATMVVAQAMLARKFLHSRNVYRQRTGVFFLSGLVLFVGHLASVAGVSPVPHHTTVPILVLGVGVGSFVLLQGNRFLRSLPFDRLLSPVAGLFDDMTPLARDFVLEEMESGVVVFDEDGRIVDINPTARRMTGAEDERVVGKKFTDVVDTDVYADGPPAFVDPDVTDGTFSNVWVELENGSRYCFDVVLTDLSEASDAQSGHVAIIHDVTDKQRRKQQLEAQKRELERQNAQLEKFAGIVSHDLRNPLNVAKGYTQDARENGDVSQLQKVENAHQRMEVLIEDMLTLARQGRSVDETEPVHVRDVVDDAWNGVETHEASLDADLGEDVVLAADPDRLQQLFENLFRNAVEHGGTDVTVTVEYADGVLAVSDDGPGVPEEKRDAVLEQGYTTSDDGTGFGLSIVQTVAQAHGWSLSVTESENGGARFEITVEERPYPRASLDVRD